jgi:L-asparaginase / beta-aspartyl-peptidase
MAVIVVHGGAGAWPEDRQAQASEGCVIAVQAGYSVLMQNGSALDAVEQAVVLLEDEPIFNAGRGSHFNHAGHVEMDAMICDGAARDLGAVAAIRNVSNPITVARMVMEFTEHCMLAGDGATKFAHAQGVPFFSDEELRGMHLPPTIGDTVGAVAVDDEGGIASATSTGGTRDKHAGRVGDSPLYGCGGYADADCGISATGDGEALIKATFARAVAEEIRAGRALEAALDTVLATLKSLGGAGGGIAVDKAGAFAARWNTRYMPWAAIDAGGAMSSNAPHNV